MSESDVMRVRFQVGDYKLEVDVGQLLSFGTDAELTWEVIDPYLERVSAVLVTVGVIKAHLSYELTQLQAAYDRKLLVWMDEAAAVISERKKEKRGGKVTDEVLRVTQDEKRAFVYQDPQAQKDLLEIESKIREVKLQLQLAEELEKTLSDRMHVLSGVSKRQFDSRFISG